MVFIPRGRDVIEVRGHVIRELVVPAMSRPPGEVRCNESRVYNEANCVRDERTSRECTMSAFVT